MAALRTQVYLTAEQRDGLDALARAEGESLAAVIRAAVDSYIENVDSLDEERAVKETFGADPDFEAPPRGEWSERERRVWLDAA